MSLKLKRAMSQAIFEKGHELMNQKELGNRSLKAKKDKRVDKIVKHVNAHHFEFNSISIQFLSYLFCMIHSICHQVLYITETIQSEY